MQQPSYADLAEGVVIDQDVFDMGANWRNYNDQLDRADRADRAIAACMRDEGHTYVPMQHRREQRASNAFDRSRGSELAFARQRGFGLTTVRDFVETAPSTSMRDRGPEQSEAYGYALYGTNGCGMAGMTEIRVNGAEVFDVSALQVFNRGLTVAEICPEWRGSLVDVEPDTELFPLDDSAACLPIGATTDLGSLDVDDDTTTQAWGRFFDAVPVLDGVDHLACRATPVGGVATVLLRDDALDGVHTQHLLWDDALWPSVMAALDGGDVAAVKIASDACGRCTAST